MANIFSANGLPYRAREVSGFILANLCVEPPNLMFKQTIIKRTGLIKTLGEMIVNDEPELHSTILELVYHMYASGVDEASGHYEVVSNFCV